MPSHAFLQHLSSYISGLFTFYPWSHLLLCISWHSNFLHSFLLFFFFSVIPYSSLRQFHTHLHHLFSKQMINPRGKILSQAIIFPGLWATVCQFVRLHLLVQHGALCGKHCCLLILPSAGTHFLFQENPQLPVHRDGEHMNSAHPLSTTSGHLDS